MLLLLLYQLLSMSATAKTILITSNTDRIQYIVLKIFIKILEIKNLKQK